MAFCLASICAWCCTVASSYGITLQVADLGDDIEVSWVSRSITRDPPFLHHEFQLQVSSNLVDWVNQGALIAGGVQSSASISNVVRLSKSSNAVFARLVYRFNMPGVDLSGMELSGADLKGAALGGADLTGANLTGADLTGANLVGANLSNATLTGAAFDSANIENAVLNGAALAGVSFRTAIGTPVLSVIGGDPNREISLAVPRLRFQPKPEDYPFDAQNGIPGSASPTIVAAAPLSATTVAQFNALLAGQRGQIVGSIPGVAGKAPGLLTIKLPATFSTIDQAVATMLASGLFSVVARDPISSPAVLPVEHGGTPGLDWNWSVPAGGGNWGMEIMEVPQLWNFSEALQKRDAPMVPPVPVGVVEGGMVSIHEDLSFEFTSTGPLTTNAPDSYLGHGAHVCGIIGATHGNSLGVEGLSPFVKMIVERPDAGLITEQWERDAVENLASLGVRVINISISTPWYRDQ